MLAAIKAFFSMLWASPITKAVVGVAIEDLTQVGKDIVSKSIPLIKEAAGKDISGKEKMEFVVAELAKEFPGAGKSLIDHCVTAAYRAYKADSV